MTVTLATAVDRSPDPIRAAAIAECAVWSEHAAPDATVPGWRSHRRGPDEIRIEYARWFGCPGEFEQRRRFPAAAGEAVDHQLNRTEDGMPQAAHHLQLLEIQDDQIIVDTVMCGGRWPASPLAEMETADV